MPPSLRRSSIRYFPARIVPIRESLVVSSATPSAGQSVVVSEYSTPHFGHCFIWYCASWCSVGGNVSLTHYHVKLRNLLKLRNGLSCATDRRGGHKCRPPYKVLRCKRA